MVYVLFMKAQHILHLLLDLEGSSHSGFFSNTEVASIVLQQKIHGRLELLALANSMTQQGDSRLYDFVLNRSQKKVNKLVETVWEVETANEKIARSNLSRIDVLREQLISACICEGE